MIERGLSRQAFGKDLVNLGGNRERIADLRIAIDHARLLTLYAAWKIDQVGAIPALTEISAIKVVHQCVAADGGSGDPDARRRRPDL
ncbi:MAG TPA: acyl-CoA dehydrogenase family protein [Edaphobacter sp.]|nr:acyl-CoA dehydrogenase family protein [Edaphobacter sp.]HUZ97620.1 acyl-CoA dehydrogenase family protein [Edaphobacter sp.]